MILGLNKYTHSTAACLLDHRGKILFALEKERLSRKKHDGGDVADLVRYVLESSGRKLSEIQLVVQNNHLFEIEAFEKRLRFTEALHAVSPSYLDPHNLLPKAKHVEISHHLAHAWSVLPVAPFDRGLIVVMDGMGSVGKPGSREGESAYRFQGKILKTIFKRWIEERTPSLHYNYGFEDMESLGAVYSRIASHIFGDWNHCGKVMGLAAYGNASKMPALVRGPLEKLSVNWEFLHSLPHVNEWKTGKHRKFYADLAARVQKDLEDTALPFFKKLRKQSGEKNLCFAGGVALNSLLNGKILREAGFEKVFIPPYPGDDGVAFGCAFYGAHQVLARPITRKSFIPYWGKSFSSNEIQQELQDFSPWIDYSNSKTHIEEIADALSRHEYVACFQGRSEFGPRALGNRSILAHPGKKSTWKHLNEKVKKREGFRPFAPTVLAERAKEFFEIQSDSPYMSLTVKARKKLAGKIAATVHVDGSCRVQTLTKEMNPNFYRLIQEFEKRTGLPVVLNTSFNIKSEPIVESPRDALRAFLDSDLDLLALENYLIRKKAFPKEKELLKLRPQLVADVLLEKQQLPSGELSRASVSTAGQSFELDELGVHLLELCDGRLSVGRMLKECPSSMRKSALGQIRQLWNQRVLFFND